VKTMAEREHVTDGGTCWCGPTLEIIGDGHIVIHNQEAE